jgi:hypothetical protein
MIGMISRPLYMSMGIWLGYLSVVTAFTDYRILPFGAMCHVFIKFMF